MTYEEVLEKITATKKFGIKPGLLRIKRLLNLLGNPQTKLKFIHVAGTNGKGSVCKMLSMVFSEASYKTGIFISPYVIDFRERFQINNEMISKNELVEIFEEIKPYLQQFDSMGDSITEFELITALAFLWFYKKKCDIVVLETGLGGRLDATNVIDSAVMSVITSISLDHTNILGNTVEEIALEKAGILKNNSQLVLYSQEEKSTQNIITNAAKALNCKVIEAKIDDFTVLKEEISGTKFIYKNEEYFLTLCGSHQLKNASVVFKVIENLKDFKINNEHIKSAFKKIKFPARFDILSKQPMIIVDGAHNPDSMAKLRDNIAKFLNGKKIIGIVAMFKDKDVESSVKLVAPLLSELVVTKINNPRTLAVKDLFNTTVSLCSNVYTAENSNLALNLALSLYDSDSVILVFGSLYLASEIYSIF